MKNVSALFLFLSFISLGQDYQLYGQSAPATYFKVDTNIHIKFNGNPTRYFYQTPLGDITIYEYKPEPSVNDSNCLYSIALYKTPPDEAKEISLSKLQMDVKFNAIISAEDNAVGNIGGKILSKEDAVIKGLQGIRMKIIFTDLSEMNEIEGYKNIMYNVLYLKYSSIVLKLWTYTPVNKVNKTIDHFFNSLTLK